MRLRPITLTEGKRFVAEHHRHNEPPVTWRFGVGVENEEGDLVGVAMAGNPVARGFATGDPFMLEVARTCTDGTPNANSMLYGAICRAAKALGFHRVVTYTLADESGASLKAAGFRADAELPARDGWAKERGGVRMATNLFGERKMPSGPKVRWMKELV